MTAKCVALSPRSDTPHRKSLNRFDGLARLPLDLHEARATRSCQSPAHYGLHCSFPRGRARCTFRLYLQQLYISRPPPATFFPTLISQLRVLASLSKHVRHVSRELHGITTSHSRSPGLTGSLYQQHRAIRTECGALEPVGIRYW